MSFRRRTGSPVSTAVLWDSRAGLLVGIYLGAIQPFVGRIARGDLHCSPFQISLIAAAPFFGNLLSPMWARQMDGRAKLPFAVWSWGIARGLFFGMLLVSSAWPFVALVCASSFIMTIATPAYASIMKEVYPDRLRGRIMGSIRVGLQGCALATALIVGRLLDHVSYRYLFPLGAAAGMMSAVCFSRMPLRAVSRPDPDEPTLTIFDTFRILSTDKPFRWFAISIFIYGFGNLLVQPVYTLYQVDRLQISNTQVANLSNLQSVVAILGFYYWGRFIDRRGSLFTVFLNIIIVGGVNLVYLAATRVEHLYLAALFNGLSGAGIELAYLNATLLFADRNRISQYQSLHSALLGVRGALGPFVGPLLLGAVGMHGTFVISLLLIWGGGVMLHFGLRGPRLGPYVEAQTAGRSVTNREPVSRIGRLPREP